MSSVRVLGMTNRNRHMAELESQRRSLAMLQTNQLALTRDQGLQLYQQLIDALEELARLRSDSVP